MHKVVFKVHKVIKVDKVHKDLKVDKVHKVTNHHLVPKDSKDLEVI